MEGASGPKQFDAIVVGAGLMGAATAWSLARRGRSVLIVEQFAPGHSHGSSHGSARIVRRAYGDALYTRLTGQAFELWRELEQQSGASILRMLGGLDFGAGRDVGLVGADLAAHGVPHEVLSAAEAEDRWPGMRFEGRVVYHPQAGTMDAALAVESFTSEALRHGAEVRSETAVVGVRADDDGAAVEFAGGERARARSVVVAAGAWIEPLLDGIVPMPPLVVTQQQIFHFPRLNAAVEPWPSTIHDQTDPIYHLAGGRDGGAGDDRKIAEHRHGTPTTAARRSGEIDPASLARVVEYVKRWLPGLDPAPGREATCLYTSTPSEDFVLDRVGALVICSACSGHGAKFAPLIGELAAELVTSLSAAQIPPRFRLASHRERFSSAQSV
jgi:sarcosine oxidase